MAIATIYTSVLLFHQTAESLAVYIFRRVRPPPAPITETLEKTVHYEQFKRFLKLETS